MLEARCDGTPRALAPGPITSYRERKHSTGDQLSLVIETIRHLVNNVTMTGRTAQSVGSEVPGSRGSPGSEFGFSAEPVFGLTAKIDGLTGCRQSLALFRITLGQFRSFRFLRN